MTAYIDFRRFAEEHLAAHPATHLYMLLDHAGLPGLYRQIARTSADWVSLFDGTSERNSLEAAPILVSIGESGRLRASRRFFDWIRQNGTFGSSVIMLSSPLELSAMKRRLGTRLDVKLSENMDGILRFFDPRVLESLIKALSEEQAELFFSPASVWWYVDRGGRLICHSSVFADVDRFSPPMELSQEQEFALLEASEVDQVLHLLKENVPSSLDNVPVSEEYRTVESIVLEAKRDGIEDVPKITLYVTFRLVQGTH